MASSHANNVKMSVSGTPGTGTITLGSASSGYQSFASAYGGNATVDVRITDGTAWEVARNCAYTHSGTTLTRGTLEASSTGSAISLTSSAVVSVILPASKGNRIESALQSVAPGGRLTLETGVPVSTSDQTAKTTVYFTPYIHNIINLWDGSDWVPTTFAETSLALGTLTSGKPYDVFAYLSSGALTLESLAWTNDTTRATAVTLQDGRLCKSGDKTRLLLGTFYTTSTTTTEDSLTKRYLSNVYNQQLKRMSATDATSHSRNSSTVREWNASSSFRCQYILTQAQNIWAHLIGKGNSFAYFGIGDNTTTTNTGYIANDNGSNERFGYTTILTRSAGFAYVTCVEFSFDAGNYSDFNLEVGLML